MPRADLPAPAAPAAAGGSGPSLRYLNEFIKLRCAPELLTLRVFPDAKEITEAMSVLSAWRAHILPLAAALPPAAAGERRCIVCVGDGCTPRSAALFAFMTQGWEAISVDPEMKARPVWTSAASRAPAAWRAAV